MTFSEQLVKNLAEVSSAVASWSKTELFVAVAAAAPVVFGFAKGGFWLWQRLHARRVGNLADREIRSIARQSFSEASLTEARRNFVEQSCSVLDPGKEVDLRATVSVRESVVKVLDRELGTGETRYLLVLADSGMGKTTLLVNLLARDLDLPVRKRRGLVLISLARDDAVERIEKISGKADKVLLLDAFDEDAEAISDHKARLATLMKAARDFGALVLTCRTQFFSHHEEIPTEIGVLRVDPRPAGQDQTHIFRKLYLLPYSESQIGTYLRKAIPWWKFEDRRKAFALGLRIRDLAARPMLLALVPDLVRSKHDAREIFQLYNFMVEMWFKRESSWVDRDTLREASKLLAVDMVLGRGRRGAESVPSTELAEVLKTLARPLEKWKLEGRSLLNRDHAGQLKFSHRSIMEYFFVVAFIEGRRETLTTAWTDQMREFLFSWGRPLGDDAELDNCSLLFSDAVRPTQLFPVAQFEDDLEVSPSALAELLKLPVPRAVSRGFPPGWGRHTLKIAIASKEWQVQEIVDGLTWSVPRVPRDQPTKRERYFNYDNIYGFDSAGSTEEAHDHMPWRTTYPLDDEARDPMSDGAKLLPTLAQFTHLALLLGRSRRLHDLLDSRERYWLRGGNGRHKHLITVRRAGDPAVDFDSDRGSEQVCTLTHRVSDYEFVMALHRCTSSRTRAACIGTSSFSPGL